jgi:L-alanine-DL-glutamate epimerase-like enolase superfamily enzyme
MGYCFVKITTSDGIVGWGEACDSFGCSYPPVIAAIVEHALAPCVLGEPVASIRRLHQKMRAATRRRLGDDWSAIHAISAVELALWDAHGKSKGESVSAMLGRHRSSVPVYASGNFLEDATPAEHVEHVSPFLEQGVRAVKFRTGLEYQDDLERLVAVRAGIDPSVDLMIDGSENYNVPTTLWIAEQLAALGVRWFEEPIPQHHRRGIEEVVRRSPVPIAYGEHLFTLAGFTDAMLRRQLHVVQPDAASCGGLLECLAVGGVAESLGLRVVPHFAAGPVAMAANLHLAASILSADLLEFAFPLADLWTTVARGAVLGRDDIVNGALPVPDAPGLGVELDETVLESLPFHSPARVTEVSRRSVGVV